MYAYAANWRTGENETAAKESLENLFPLDVTHSLLPKHRSCAVHQQRQQRQRRAGLSRLQDCWLYGVTLLYNSVAYTQVVWHLQ